MVSVGHAPGVATPQWSLRSIAPARPTRRWSTLPVSTRRAIGGVLFLVAVAAPLLRQTGTASWHTVFAEDGSIYTAQAVRSGGLAVLFRGYAGYLQLPPRLLGALTPYVPFRHLTVYLALSSTLVVALLAWFVFWATEGWVSSVALRFLLAALVVVSPVMGLENTANITNTIWAFLLVAPWALIATDERTRATVVRSVVAFLAATASPLSLLFLPLAVAVAVRRRSRSAWTVLAAFAVGLVIQVLVSWRTPNVVSSLHGTSRSFAQLRDGLSVRVFGEFLLGPKPLHPLWLHDWRAVVVLAPLVTLLIFVLAARGARRRSQLAGMAFFVYAVALFVVPTWGRGTWVLLMHEGQPLSDSAIRFSVVPLFLLASALAILLDQRGARARPVARVAGFALIAQMSVLMLVNFQSVTIDSGQTNWHQEVSHVFVAECARRPSGQLVTIPSFLPVTVPCSQLGD